MRAPAQRQRRTAADQQLTDTEARHIDRTLFTSHRAHVVLEPRSGDGRCVMSVSDR